MNPAPNLHPKSTAIAAESRLWGPYLSDRQWGTVREDYSGDGNAWAYFTHDMARYRAYRWGEDGIGGISDKHQQLCFAPAFWNGNDSILKERLFGLSGPEGNHGEDVKEIYYYLDATPSHSYLKMLYKYPQQAFPYEELIERNRVATKTDSEYELLDTGILDENRYFDLFIEYAKVASTDILIRITAINRSDHAAPLHLLPQLWFRNTWSWGRPNGSRPHLVQEDDYSALAVHHKLRNYRFVVRENSHTSPQWMFTENETHPAHASDDQPADGFYKGAFHDFIVHNQHHTINPESTGTKLGVLLSSQVPAGESRSFDFRLFAVDDSKLAAAHHQDCFVDFNEQFQNQREEADQFYASTQANIADPDERAIQRQAFAGLIWSKQFYYLDVSQWQEGDPTQPAPAKERESIRNSQWSHLRNEDIISMPDTWEYPWYAAWDLAFHCIPLALIDSDFAKQQLILMTREWYMHPNGQMPGLRVGIW